MASENTVLTKVINRKLKKCGFCNKELKPIGFDYLYENVSPDCIEYERCDCEKSKQYWAKKDKEDYLNMKREHYRKIINQLYKDSYMKKNYQNMNLSLKIGVEALFSARYLHILKRESTTFSR